MANVSCMEPQVIVDLLTCSLEHAIRQGQPSEECIIGVTSPWFSDIELALHPSGNHECLGLKRNASNLRLNDALLQFARLGWKVNVAVLKYGRSHCGMTKDHSHFEREKRILRTLIDSGINVYLCPNLHAKGLITPLGVITGSTNLTHSGMNLQMQNAMYFPLNHTDYTSTKEQLMIYFRDEWKVTSIP